MRLINLEHCFQDSLVGVSAHVQIWKHETELKSGKKGGTEGFEMGDEEDTQLFDHRFEGEAV